MCEECWSGAQAPYCMSALGKMYNVLPNCGSKKFDRSWNGVRFMMPMELNSSWSFNSICDCTMRNQPLGYCQWWRHKNVSQSYRSNCNFFKSSTSFLSTKYFEFVCLMNLTPKMLMRFISAVVNFILINQLCSSHKRH